jgi:hypothetical protein
LLSIGKLVAGQERYYEQQVALGRDDYYAGSGEAPGRWMGAGAAELGLDGEVDAEAFGALIAGRDPNGGEVLRGGSGRDRVCALDLTFSAPKRVSVLFAIGDVQTSRALVEAHEEAVGAAVGYLEREACRVRRGRGGRIELPADGLVAAALSASDEPGRPAAAAYVDVVLAVIAARDHAVAYRHLEALGHKPLAQLAAILPPLACLLVEARAGGVVAGDHDRLAWIALEQGRGELMVHHGGPRLPKTRLWPPGGPTWNKSGSSGRR